MRRILGVILGLVLAIGMVPAQTSRGSLTGTVTDTSGAIVPGVLVTVVMSATGAKYETRTNELGLYNVASLPSGTYEASFEEQGFKKSVQKAIEVGISDVRRLDVTLEIGAVADAIEVTAPVARVQTDSAEVGTSLSNKSLLDLPLTFSGGRIAESFAFAVTPGVTGSSWTAQINGSTSQSKETLLDGATVTTERAGHFGESSVSVEALQEFKVQTSGISAEYGRAQMGVFNYVMKSGANQVHGSGYAAIRNESLNANTFSNNFRGLPRAQDRKHNYAGSFGGPVYLPKLYDGRNKTFFYVTYEKYHEVTRGYGSPSVSLPVPEFYNGDFSRLLGPALSYTDALGRPVHKGAIYDPATFRQLADGRWVGDMFENNQIPLSRFSEASKKFNSVMQQHYLPTIKDSNGQIPLINNAVYPNGTPWLNQYQFSVKMDHNIGNSHKLSGSFSYILRSRLLLWGGVWDESDPEGGPLSSAKAQPLRTTYGRIADDWTISPTVLNHFMVHHNRTINPIANTHADINGAQAMGLKGLSLDGFPIVDWSSGPYYGLTSPGENANWFFAEEGMGLSDTVSFSKGRHFMKVGLDMRLNRWNHRWNQEAHFNFNPRATAIPNEVFSGNNTGYAFASYLLGLVDSASLTDPVPLGSRHWYYAAFVNDDFKVNNRLSLNLGLRWEFQPPAQEVGDRLSSWDPTVIDPATGLPGAYTFAGNCDVCTGQRYFGVRKPFHDFGPRVGFAYQAPHNWVVRGAYGIMYEGDVNNSGSGPSPLGKATSVAWGGTYSLNADPVNPWKGLYNWDNAFPAGSYTPASFDRSWGDRNAPGMYDPNYGTSPYVQMWNLNIQKEVVKNLVVDIGYVGNKGTGLRDGQLAIVNQLPSSVLSTYGLKLRNPITSAADAAANGIAYPYAGFKGTVASALRYYPQVQGNSTVQVYAAPLGFSAFHSLQVTVNRQFSKGLSIYGDYVWSKSLANVSSSEPTSNSGPLDYYNLSLEKGVTAADRSHQIKAYLDYELPVGTGKALRPGSGKVANALLGGWSVSAILQYNSGAPIGVGGSSPLSGAWNGSRNRANIAPGPMVVSDFDKSMFNLGLATDPNNTYLNKSLFSDAAPLTLGTSANRYTQARGFWVRNENLSLRKVFSFKERYHAQLRIDAFNAFNRSTLGGPNTSITSANFGQITSISGNRTVQIGMRLDF